MRHEPTLGLAAQDLAHRFIRLGLAGFWLEAARAQAQSLAAQVDWPVARGLAAAERLAPLLSFALRDCPTAPPEVLLGWRQAYTNNARRNLYLLHNLEQLLAGLTAASVPVRVLKGVALIAGAYDGNIALRPLRDIDLLIHPAALPAALRAFDALGYQPADLEPQPGAAATFESQRRMRRPGTVDTIVEIHWSLFDSPYYQHRLSLDRIWQTARPARIGALSFVVLSPEDHLLYLCGHIWLHHRGAGLLWRHDIAALIRAAGPSLNWPEVLRQAQAWELVLPLQRVLPELASDYALIELEPVIQELRLLRPGRGEQAIFAQLTAPRRPVASRFWADLSSTAGWAGRLGFAAANLFPSQSYMRQRYGIAHPAWMALYYPYRWFLGARSALWKRK